MKNILDRSFRWVYESFNLLKLSTRFSLIAGMFYLMFYMFIPASPGLSLLTPVLIIFWPFIAVYIISYYLSVLNNKPYDFKKMTDSIKGKFSKLIYIGFLYIFYTILLSVLISEDVIKINEIAQTSELKAIETKDLTAIALKALILTIPFLMLTWFAPFLVVFNNFDFFKSIKSSFAGCLMFFVPILITWLIFVCIFVGLIVLITFVISSMNFLGMNFISLFTSFFILFLAIIFISITFIFQAIAFKEIFKSII